VIGLRFTQMREALLAVSIAVFALAGCGGSPGPAQLPEHPDQGLYVICTGKPRFCAVADLRDPHPEWKSATELSGEEAVRFRRLADSGSVPIPP
jgi:hypothetical protein